MDLLLAFADAFDDLRCEAMISMVLMSRSIIARR